VIINLVTDEHCLISMMRDHSATKQILHSKLSLDWIPCIKNNKFHIFTKTIALHWTVQLK